MYFVITRNVAVRVMIIAALAATAACQPRVTKELRVENHLSETVSVRWVGDSMHSRQIRPGQDMSIPVGDPGCFRIGQEDVLVATTPGGRTLTFGPPACLGGSWRIGP
jgi:hypothetical protein